MRWLPCGRTRSSCVSCAKFWLAPVALAANIGFSARELRDIERIVVGHEATLIKEWDGYFGP